MDLMDLMDQMDKVGGATVYPGGLRGAVWFGAGQIYRWGDYCNRRTNHTIS